MKQVTKADDVITDTQTNCGGLTKREYFAALIMQGLCSYEPFRSLPTATAKDAVYRADQLIKALNEDQD